MRVSEASSTDFGRIGSNIREGVLEHKFLLQGKPGSLSNYLINVGRTGAGGWTAPRHRYNFDQLRYVIKGSFPYGQGKSMPEGWVGYFPESVYYGPQDRHEGLEMMVAQFGGAAGYGFVSVEEREARIRVVPGDMVERAMSRAGTAFARPSAVGSSGIASSSSPPSGGRVSASVWPCGDHLWNCLKIELQVTNTVLSALRPISCIRVRPAAAHPREPDRATARTLPTAGGEANRRSGWRPVVGQPGRHVGRGLQHQISLS